MKVSKGFRDIERKMGYQRREGGRAGMITDREWSCGMIHMSEEPRDIPESARRESGGEKNGECEGLHKGEAESLQVMGNDHPGQGRAGGHDLCH